MPLRFKGNFTQQPPIPEEGIERAVAVMRSGRLHRYNVVDGEVPETVLLENEFAAYMGARFCLACTSGGYALQTALRAFGLSPGEPVLANGLRIPLTFGVEDCRLIGRIVADCLAKLGARTEHGQRRRGS